MLCCVSCCYDLNLQCLQIKKAAQKRKEEDADFEEKRMILGITAEGDEDENDKENMIRRREIMRNRLEKDSMFHEEEDRNRREGDIVSRWRDKRDSSPVHYRVCIFFYSLVLVFNDCLCVCVLWFVMLSRMIRCFPTYWCVKIRTNVTESLEKRLYLSSRVFLTASC